MPFSPPPTSSSSHFIIDSLLSLLLLTLKILIWPSLSVANDTQYLVSQIINANWLLNKAVNLCRRKSFKIIQCNKWNDGQREKRRAGRKGRSWRHGSQSQDSTA